jgi:hypothetical protein
MTVHAKSTEKSVLRDARRRKQDGSFDQAPLGLDPVFMTFNFEIEVKLKAGSDPKLCPEHQQVKRTSVVAGDAAQDKKACTAGWMRATCQENTDCDFRTCHGGSNDGHPANTPGEKIACVAAGGDQTFPVTINGVCTPFPMSGPLLGNDDYSSPMENSFKSHANPKAPRWFDDPGYQHLPRSAAKKNFRWESEFVAEVDGDGSDDCRCRFNIIMDWNATTKSYSGDSKLTELGGGLKCFPITDP